MGPEGGLFVSIQVCLNTTFKLTVCPVAVRGGFVPFPDTRPSMVFVSRISLSFNPCMLELFSFVLFYDSDTVLLRPPRFLSFAASPVTQVVAFIHRIGPVRGHLTPPISTTTFSSAR